MLSLYIQRSAKDKGTKIGNYTIAVAVNDTIIDSFSVKNHVRSEGWIKLLELIVKEAKNGTRIPWSGQVKS